MVSFLSESPKTPRVEAPKSSKREFEDLAEDAELLAIFVQTRNTAAIEKLILRHSPLVAGLVRRMLQNPNDAEDAFQATFLILIKSAPKIRRQGSLSAWLYGVAFRTACRIRRQSKERQTISMGGTEDIVTLKEVDPLEKIAMDSQLELLDRELQNLKPSLRDILIEHHLVGMSVPQIADRYDLTNSAVEGRLRRGRAALRQKLARRGICFSVAVAVASAYQSRSVAFWAEPWQQRFLQSDFYSQTVATGSPPANGPLQSLVQGEPVMPSVFSTRNFSMAVASLVIAGGLIALPLIPAGDNQPKAPSMFVASASAETEVSSQPVVIDPNTLATNGSESKSTSRSNPGPRFIPFTKPEGPMPNWMTSGGTMAEEEDKAREGLRRNLRKLVKVDFTNVTLRNVLDTLRSDTNIPFLVDEAAIAESGTVTLEDPINLLLMPEISLQRALKIILEPLELAYVIEPEHIKITTKDNSKNRSLRTYDLAYLLSSNEKSQELVQLIRTMVPSNWDLNGGEDTLQVFGSMLLVSCPEETHLGIEGLLFSLSKMTKGNIDIPTNPADPNMLPSNGGIGR